MGDGSEIVVNLLFAAVFGAITAAIASSKGRNAVGWFFGGFFLGCIGLIIILCLSNLKEEQAKWSAQDIEQRRLREQLRQEQLKNEALRQHTVARLDMHDQELGVDTRQAAPGLNLSGSPAPARLITGEVATPPPGFPATDWYTNDGGEQQGPYTFALLHTRARQGTLAPETLIWVEGMEEWQPAHLIPNLMPS
jgi:hypothetical protein